MDIEVDNIRAFTVEVPQASLDDLEERLARTRWPEKETVDGWDQGIPLAYAQESRTIGATITIGAGPKRA